MAPSLRQRLGGKRHTSPDAKGTATDHEDSGSSTSLRESKMSKLMQREQEQQPPSQDDLSSMPPPDRKLRSSSEKTSRNVSTSQSLIDRYKNRVGKASVKTSLTSVGSTQDGETYKVGKNTIFGENFDDEASPIQADWVNAPGTLNNEKEVPQTTRVYKGVEFEMMGKKGEAAQAPVATGHEDGFVFERRTTRSQTRREQRADSHDANLASKYPNQSEKLVPSKLTINKNGGYEMARTPSPRASPGSAVRSLSQLTPTPSNSPRQLPDIPRQLSTRRTDRSKDAIPLSRLSPSPDPITGMPMFNLSIRSKASDSPTSNDKLSATPVIPPPFDPNVANGYQWASPLGSTSRPSEPWGRLKTWTCS